MLLAVAVGLGLRLRGLDEPFDHDETMTALRARGSCAYVLGDLRRPGLTAADWARRLAPAPELGLRDTVACLVREDPKHGPIYFAAAHLWSRWAGLAPPELRALGSVIFLLTVPLLFLLARDLFGGRSYGVAASVLLALSPHQIAAAQTARPQGLLALWMVLTSWLLLRAIERPRPVHWVGYGVAGALGLLTHPMFVFAIVAHGAFVLLRTGRGGGRWRSFGAFSLGTALAGALYLPWLLSAWGRFGQGTEWLTAGSGGVAQRAANLLSTLAGVVMDLSWVHGHVVTIGVALVVLLPIAASAWWMSRQAPAAARLSLALFASAYVGLGLLDLGDGGHRTEVARYLSASQLGVLLIASWGVIRFAEFLPAVWMRASATGTLTAVALLLLLAANARSPLDRVATFLAARPGAFLFVGASPPKWIVHVLAMSPHLPPAMPVVRADVVRDPEAAGGHDEVFVYGPKPGWREGLAARGYQFLPVADAPNLFRVVSPSPRPEPARR